MQCAFLFSLIFLSFSFSQASEEESGKPFQCPICGLVIKRKSYWKRHMVIHTGLKSHQCPLCPFRCARKDNLKSHMKVSPLRTGRRGRHSQGPRTSRGLSSGSKVECDAGKRIRVGKDLVISIFMSIGQPRTERQRAASAAR